MLELESAGIIALSCCNHGLGKPKTIRLDNGMTFESVVNLADARAKVLDWFSGQTSGKF